MKLNSDTKVVICEDGIDLFQTNGANIITLTVLESIKLAEEILKQYNIKSK